MRLTNDSRTCRQLKQVERALPKRKIEGARCEPRPKGRGIVLGRGFVPLPKWR